MKINKEQFTFRGFSDHLQTWIYGGVHRTKDYIFIIDNRDNQAKVVNENTIGQFTTEKDIKGNHLYQGDIIDYSDGDDPSYYIIEWGNQGFIPDEFPLSDTVKVGNIYDNVELAKELEE